MKGEAKGLVAHFGSLYREKIGESYPPSWGRDLKIFNDMLKSYSREKLEKFLDIYFNAERKIYAIPFFKVALGELIQIEKKEEKNKPLPMQDNESWRFA